MGLNFLESFAMPWTQDKIESHKNPVWDIWTQLRYRLPMQVTSERKLGSLGYFPVCPRCQMTIEREYMGYCDRCGQKLDWKMCEYSDLLCNK